jgi:hypothetical protein
VRVRAVDAAGNRSAWRYRVAVVPADDRSFRFSSGTVRRTGSAYQNGTSTTTNHGNAKITVKFTGSSFHLVAMTGRDQGRLRITIDGVSSTLDLGYQQGVRAATNTRRVLVFTKELANGAHTVVLTNLATSGRPTVNIDAVGWRQ